jgi:hypothetical protein
MEADCGLPEMTDSDFDPLKAVGILTRHQVRFILIGGFAAALRGSPVITGDTDVCYAREEENLERLATALKELRATLRGAPADVPFQFDSETLQRGDAFTFNTVAGPLDCVGTPAGTAGFDDLDEGATDEDLDGLTVRVASIEDLIRMKRASGRPKDLIGLEWLGGVRDELERE